MRVGAIGPTDVGRQAQFTSTSILTIEARVSLVGRILAEMGKELWLNPDGGTLEILARSYLEHGGPHLVMLLPADDSNDWPVHDKARQVAQLGHEIRRPENWAAANREVVTIPEVVVCVGMSMGTRSELAFSSIRWNARFMEENPELRPLIAIRGLLQGGKFPSDFEQVLSGVLQYVDTAEELRPVLARLQGQVVEPMPS